MFKKGCVYCLEFPNGKKYVGITTMLIPQYRLRYHSKRVGSLLGRAICKCGIDQVRFLILEQDLFWKELCILERYYIRKYKTRSPNGYNLTDGGEGIIGYQHTLKARRAISNCLLARWKNKEYQAFMKKELLKGCTSKKARKLASEKLKERWKDPSWRKVMIAKTAMAASKSLRNKWKDPLYRKKMIKVLRKNNRRLQFQK